jgi:hypothetical protein
MAAEQPVCSRIHHERGEFAVYGYIAPPSTVRRVVFEDGTVDFLPDSEIESHPLLIEHFFDRVFPIPGPSVRKPA